MTVINLTPHAINIVNEDNELVRMYPSSGLARLTTSTHELETIDNTPVLQTVFDGVVGLPEPSEGTFYLVSMPVCQYLKDRSDLICPDSGSTAYRDAKGQIIGVKGFVKY